MLVECALVWSSKGTLMIRSLHRLDSSGLSHQTARQCRLAGPQRVILFLTDSAAALLQLEDSAPQPEVSVQARGAVQCLRCTFFS